MGVPMWQGGSSQESKASGRGRAKARGWEPHLAWGGGQTEGSQGRHLRTGPRGGEKWGRGDARVTEGEDSGGGRGEMGQQ